MDDIQATQSSVFDQTTGLFELASPQDILTALAQPATALLAPLAEQARTSDADASLVGDGLINRLSGGPKTDRIIGKAGSDQILGRQGMDILDGGSGSDRLLGHGGADLLTGSGGGDRLLGDQGRDILWGDRGRDRLKGGSDGDLLLGGTNRDRLTGQSGDDLLWGEGGRDDLKGSRGNDWVWGGRATDTLRGDGGRDVLAGEAGNDQLEGGSGADILVGGIGEDTLIGGEGADTFVVAADGIDKILDFEVGVDALWVDGDRPWTTQSQGTDTLIQGQTGETLAVLSGVTVLDSPTTLISNAQGAPPPQSSAGIDPPPPPAPLPDLTIPLPEDPMLPAVTDIYTVRPDILAITVETGEVTYGQQVPYVPLAGDRLVQEGNETWLRRNGELVGNLVGKDQSLLYTFDQLAGDPLDTEWADQTFSYSLSSPTDQEFVGAIAPTNVFRKSAPTSMARVGRWEFDWAMEHTLYLQLPKELEVGEIYSLDFNAGQLRDFSFRYLPDQDVSEAVHVSHIGFRPDDPNKVGYLSAWIGNGGSLDYPDGQTFWVIDEATQERVFTGVTEKTLAPGELEDPRDRNYTRTEVHRMDFSALTRPGQYRVYVDGVGTSLPFEIGETVWQEAFTTSARGFYHQRSGIELTQPYTDWERPRPFHPDDGLKVYQSTASLMDTKNGLNAAGVDEDNFASLVSGKTEQVVKDAWGGYFDAGDWDRRIQHLGVARSLLELAELFPDYFADVSLNIPESHNALPDIVDEALWGLDFFKRLQLNNGGIRGGIESSGHPLHGEASWQESLEVMVYAPDPWSSYIYAGTAAQAASLLESQFPALAADYRQSAIKAMNYAERELGKYAPDALPHAVKDERNLAAIELYRLTGNRRWHNLFLETTVFTDPEQPVVEPGLHAQRDAAFVYSRLDPALVDGVVQTNARTALLAEADTVAAYTEETGFGWTKLNPWEPVSWGASSLAVPNVLPMLRAHALTGDEAYLEASLLASQFSAGANPLNKTFTTGVGHDFPQHPLVVDQRIMGVEPPPGITVYGPLDSVRYGDYWGWKLLQDSVFPNAYGWPTVEAYFDVYQLPAMNEFTIMQSMMPTAYTWGYLAARSGEG
ncbi:MAG: glycoside hydrolase family 9 protein [Synechococcales bacterium]|nr:glycoside hydrolase family 9 protein [Synechococcales bacterium]